MFAPPIIFLKGNPELKPAKMPCRADSLVELFESDLKDEKEALKLYVRATRQASDDGDIGSRILFEQTAIDEEGHMSW